MAKGFFTLSAPKVSPVQIRTPRCGECKLFQQCNSPKMPPTGKGKKGILIVAEAPGKTEDAQGIQLVGDAGQRLRQHLDMLDIDLDEDCIKTNAIICRPPNNRKPEPAEIAACRPNLFNTIEQYNPSVIILLGQTAVDSLLSPVWGGEIGTIERWVGWRIPCGNPNAWIVPTWHPSFLLRNEKPVLDLLFRKHLAKAVEVAGTRPPKPKDYASEVRIEYRPHVAAKLIDRFTRATDRPCAFDYEVTALKPETKGARILSCAISDGHRTIAYPWHGEATAATIRFLQSSVPKIGANIQFEERWSQVHAGGPVRGWLFDTMLGGHVLDNRPDIVGLKFQGFVLLGYPNYAAHLEPYMEEYRNGLNRLAEVNLKDLLLYNGIDAALDWDVAQIQIQQMAKIWRAGQPAEMVL